MTVVARHVIARLALRRYLQLTRVFSTVTDFANTHSLAVRARGNSGPFVREWVLPTCSHLIILLGKAGPVVGIFAGLITVASRVAVSAIVIADGQAMTQDGCNVE